MPIDGESGDGGRRRKFGGDVTFTVYPGAGHGVCDKTYGDGRFFEWLLAQRRKRDKRQGRGAMTASFLLLMSIALTGVPDVDRGTFRSPRASLPHRGGSREGHSRIACSCRGR